MDFYHPLLEAAARVAHEVNRVWCESIGDTSQPTWADAPTWQKDSARSGVRHLIENPNATSEDSHKNWLADKEADGWVYGPTKDPETKVHPCMVPYGDLPKNQRIKDAFFGASVRAALGQETPNGTA